jgi:hypothetical protein
VLHGPYFRPGEMPSRAGSVSSVARRLVGGVSASDRAQIRNDKAWYAVRTFEPWSPGRHVTFQFSPWPRSSAEGRPFWRAPRTHCELAS